MKTILCYGDSNTWGWNPKDASRFTREERWTGLLMQELGEEFYVIEEGLNGRTTIFDDPIEGIEKMDKPILSHVLLRMRQLIS